MTTSNTGSSKSKYNFNQAQAQGKVNGVSGKAPRFWGDQGPKEQWAKTLPATSCSQEMYEAVQEMLVDPRFEWAGKVGSFMREAVEEMLDKYYSKDESMTLYQQMRQFRDAWIEEKIANELLDNLNIIETTLVRWRMAGDIERIILTFQKLLHSINLLPREWRSLVLDKARESESIREAMNWVLHEGDIDVRRELEKVHEVIYA